MRNKLPETESLFGGRKNVEIEELIEVFRKRHFLRLRNIFFEQINEYRILKKEMASLNELAYEYNEIKLMRKMLSTLKLNATQYDYSEHQVDLIFSRNKKNLNDRSIRRIFSCWKQLHLKKLRPDFLNLKKAEKFRIDNSRRKVFRLFKKNSLLIDDKQSVIRENHGGFLVKGIFRKWKSEALDFSSKRQYLQKRQKYIMKKKMMEALRGFVK